MHLLRLMDLISDSDACVTYLDDLSSLTLNLLPPCIYRVPFPTMAPHDPLIVPEVRHQPSSRVAVRRITNGVMIGMNMDLRLIVLERYVHAFGALEPKQ